MCDGRCVMNMELETDLWTDLENDDGGGWGWVG